VRRRVLKRRYGHAGRSGKHRKHWYELKHNRKANLWGYEALGIESTPNNRFATSKEARAAAKACIDRFLKGGK